MTLIPEMGTATDASMMDDPAPAVNTRSKIVQPAQRVLSRWRSRAVSPLPFFITGFNASVVRATNRTITTEDRPSSRLLRGLLSDLSCAGHFPSVDVCRLRNLESGPWLQTLPGRILPALQLYDMVTNLTCIMKCVEGALTIWPGTPNNTPSIFIPTAYHPLRAFDTFRHPFDKHGGAQRRPGIRRTVATPLRPR